MKTNRMNTHETDGKFAIRSFRKVADFESAANDRIAFADVAASVGCDGSLFSAPKGFAKWTFQAQMGEVCYLFCLAPVTVEMPVSVEVNA